MEAAALLRPAPRSRTDLSIGTRIGATLYVSPPTKGGDFDPNRSPQSNGHGHLDRYPASEYHSENGGIAFEIEPLSPANLRGWFH